MAFNQICATMINGCTKLLIKDSTGPYDATSNTSGWDAPTTIAPADVTAATIEYFIGDSTTGTTIDVLSEIPNPVTTQYFTLAEVDVEDSYEDGYITIIYTLTTATNTYKTRTKVFFTCSSRCCIDNMWAQIAEKCNCDCDIDQMISDALMAEGLLKAVQSAARCNVTDGVTDMIAKIKRLCDFNDCNCS